MQILNEKCNVITILLLLDYISSCAFVFYPKCPQATVFLTVANAIRHHIVTPRSTFTMIYTCMKDTNKNVIPIQSPAQITIKCAFLRDKICDVPVAILLNTVTCRTLMTLL